MVDYKMKLGDKMKSTIEKILKKCIPFQLYLYLKRIVREIKKRINPNMIWSYRKEYVNDMKLEGNERYFVLRRSLYLFGIMGAWRDFLVSLPWIQAHGYTPLMYFGATDDMENADYVDNIWSFFLNKRPMLSLLINRTE